MSLETFTEAYIECAFWSSCAEDGTPLDGIEADPSPECIAKLETDARDFYEAHSELFADDSQAGHDFWLTRNGHGAGFWDRGLGEVGEKLTAASKHYGSCDLIVGDDGQIHCL